jgi:transposase
VQGSGRMKASPEIIELDVSKLEALLEQIQAVLGEEVARPFRELLHGYQQFLQMLENKEFSLRKLQQLLFGVKTESSRNVLGSESTLTGDGPAPPPATAAGDGATSASLPATSAPATSAEEEREPAGGGQRHSPPKGHGRNGASAYTGCAKVAVPLGRLHSGDACPACDGGKVYASLGPRCLVRLVGQAPVGGTVYELQQLRCHLCGAVFTADPPAGVGHEKYDATAIAMMALLRYGHGMPWNRSAALQQSLGIPLPAMTQWDLLRKAAAQLRSVYEHFILQAAQGKVVYNDDTGMRVLELMDEKRRGQALREDDPDRRGIFTTGIVSVADGHSLALFFTGPRHAGENLREVLLRRAAGLPPPLQMCDALDRNVPKDLEVILANCLSHGRRRFVELADVFPAEVTYILEALKQVYQVDTEAKQQELSPEARLHLHQQRSGPVMEELHRWLQSQFAQKKVEPNGSLGQAITYLLRHWQKLTLFLRVPGAPLDNNICERALKMAIRHRKNSLFYKSRRGAFVGDLFMSLIHTCFLCDADPLDYLTQLLRNHQQAAQSPQQWMPWNYRATAASVRAEPAKCRDSPCDAHS